MKKTIERLAEAGFAISGKLNYYIISAKNDLSKARSDRDQAQCSDSGWVKAERRLRRLEGYCSSIFDHDNKESSCILIMQSQDLEWPCGECEVVCSN